MSCGFDLEHYRELLRAATAGGYRWTFFDAEPQAGDLFLRHDVDLSLDAALRVAELEAEQGAAATYFLLTESVFYNLASSEGRTAIARLRELGVARISLGEYVYADAMDFVRDRLLSLRGPAS